MKKLLKKSILTFVAVLAVSSTMALSAFAAITATPKYDKGTNTLTVEITGGNNGDQLTILLLKPDTDDTKVVAESIVYIDQESADANGGHTYEIKLPAGIADGTYKLKVGGTNVNPEEIVIKDVVIGEGGKKYMIGDADASGAIDADDATAILYHVVRNSYFYPDFKDEDGKVIPKMALDVDGSEAVDADDATGILYHVVRNSYFYPTFPRTSY